MIMKKTNLLFAALIVGLVSAGGEGQNKAFLDQIAMGPYREGSSHVHTEPGDNVSAGPVVSNVPVLPNIHIGAPTNDDLRKQLVAKAGNDDQWLTDESTLKTYDRYKKHPRYEGPFDEETDNDTFDNKTAVDSKKFYIRGQKRGRHVHRFHVESYGPRKRALRRARRHHRHRSDVSYSRTRDGSCTDDYKHCRRRHDRNGRHISRSSTSSSVESTRSRSYHRRDRSRSLSSSSSRSTDRRSRRDRNRSRGRRSHRDRSRRDRSRSRDRSRDRRSRSRNDRSGGNYGRYHSAYSSLNNFNASGERLYTA